MAKTLTNAAPNAAGAAAPVLPGDLENSLFRLLARLEQMLARLAEPAVLQRPAQALQVAVAMVDQVVALAARWVRADPHGAKQSKLLAAAREVYSSVEALDRPLSDSVVMSLFQLFAKEDKNDLDRNDLYRSAITASCAVLEEAFALFADCLGSPTDSAAWQQANTVFLAELAQVVSKIKF
jgi:hypothetical protein